MHYMSFPIHPGIIEAYALSRKKLEPFGRYILLITLLKMNNSINTMKVSLNFVRSKDCIAQLKYPQYYISRQGLKEVFSLPLRKSSAMKAMRHLLLFIT